MVDENNSENLEKSIIGEMASGEIVFDQLHSHIHPTVRKFIPVFLSKIVSDRGKIIIREFRIDKELPLHLIKVNPKSDELYLAQRQGREGLSVFVKNRFVGKTNIIVMILKMDGMINKNETANYILLTAHAGKASPREPWDVWFDGGETIEERKVRKKLKDRSLQFWMTHALIPDEIGLPIIKNSEQSFDYRALLQKIM